MKTLHELTGNYSEINVSAWNISHDGKILAYLDYNNLAFGVGMRSSRVLYQFKNMEYNEFGKKRWAVVENSQASNILKHYFLNYIFPHTIAFDNEGKKYNLNDELFTVARKPYGTGCSTFILKDNADNSYIELMSDGIWNENALLKEDPNEPKVGPNEPKVGNVCRFWDGSNYDNNMIGVLRSLDPAPYHFASTSGHRFENAEKITNPEIIKLFSND